jgi:ATP-dependent RNA helicase DDX54/DBP10
MDTKDSNPFKDIAAAETTGPKKKAGSFQSLGLNQALLRGVLNKGYKVPTPIQRKSIPLALAGEDLIAMVTGSGGFLPLILEGSYRFW